MDFKSWPYWLKGIILGVITAFVISIPFDVIFSYISFQRINIVAILLNILEGAIIGGAAGLIYDRIKKKSKVKNKSSFFTFTTLKFIIFLCLIFLTFILYGFSFACMFAGGNICTIGLAIINILTLSFWISSVFQNSAIGQSLILNILAWILQILWFYFLACLISYLYNKITNKKGNKKRKKK